MGRAVPLAPSILAARGDETPMRRDLEQAKRLELGLVKVRWLLIAYGLVQTMVERVDPNAPSYAFELGLVLTTGDVAQQPLLHAVRPAGPASSPTFAGSAPWRSCWTPS